MSDMRKRAPVPEPHQVLTTEQLAAWMRKAPRTVERMNLPRIAPGRYLFAHVLDELDKRRKKARVA